MKKVLIAIFVASIFWFIMFSPWTAPSVNFWYTMILAAGTLIGLSFWFGKDWKSVIRFNVKDIAIGAGSAVLLYGIFYLGNEISNILFDFARSQIDNVYAIRDGENPLFMGLALLLLIGPAEEIFWRGYIQRSLEKSKLGEWGAFILTVIIYTLVHIWSFNFMLIMSAMVCGLFWGFIYMRNKNLTTVLVSHAIWDVAVLILLPIK